MTESVVNFVFIVSVTGCMLGGLMLYLRRHGDEFMAAMDDTDYNSAGVFFRCIRAMTKLVAYAALGAITGMVVSFTVCVTIKIGGFTAAVESITAIAFLVLANIMYRHHCQMD